MSDQPEQPNQEIQESQPNIVATIPNVEVRPEPAQDADDGRDYQAEIKKLREEAAKWRTQFRDAEKQVKELSPAAKRLAELEEAQKTEEQKLREKIAAMENATKEAEYKADLANKRAKLTSLSAKAGINPDLAALLDINQIDFDDESALIETLKQFAPSKPPINGGGASNPANSDNTEPSEKELVANYFRPAGRNITLFGGK